LKIFGRDGELFIFATRFETDTSKKQVEKKRKRGKSNG